MPAAAQRLVREYRVQTASTLPPFDAQWTTQPFLKFGGAVQGSGQTLGSATLTQDFGQIKTQAASSFAEVGITPDIAGTGSAGTLRGKVVRILEQDDAGTVTIGGDTFTPFWWGMIQSQDIASAGDTGGGVSWSAVEIAGALEQVYIRGGYVLHPTIPSAIVDPGFMPPFNKLAGGDRSTDTHSIGGGTVHIHDLATGASGNLWTARQILDLILRGPARPVASGSIVGIYGGWSWEVEDDDGCLAYTPECLDLNGMTVLAAVNSLVNARRGLTWWVTVDGSTATINVSSGTPTAITVGTFTVPDAGSMQVLDTTGDEWIDGVEISEDSSTEYDVIEVRGAQPWVGLTLKFDGSGSSSLLEGWTGPEEARWVTDVRAGLAEAVHRRFTIDPAWVGASDGGTGIGLRDTLGVATSEEYGAGGFDGSRTHSGGGAGSKTPPSYMLETERTLPCSLAFTTLRLGTRQPPVVIFYDGASEYEDVSKLYQVQTDDSPPAVWLDDGADGTDMESRMAATGAYFYVTVAFRESQPLKVSWVRAPGDWPSSLPRIKMIEVREAEQWIVLDDTVTSVDAVAAVGTAVAKTSADVVVRDDTDKLRAVLALARIYFASPSRTVSWTDRGQLDRSATYRPGVLLTTITSGGVTRTINATITSRRWVLVNRNGVEMFDTVYSTARVIPELECVL